MSARYLNLPNCPYCAKGVQCIIEEDVSEYSTYYTVRCNCTALTTSVTKEAIEQGGEPYAIEIADQRWKNAVDKMHMAEVRAPSNEENPGSREETGVSNDAVWDAVIRAMLLSYYKGITYANHGDVHDNLTREELEEILKSRLDKVIDNPPDGPY